MARGARFSNENRFYFFFKKLILNSEVCVSQTALKLITNTSDIRRVPVTPLDGWLLATPVLKRIFFGRRIC